jgi:hypothetical protein
MCAFSIALPPANYLNLRYRPDLHLLVARWQRPVSAAEFRQGWRAILRLAREHNCPYWQLDLRGRGALPHGEIQQWLRHRLVPEIAQCLSQPVCLAYLLSPAHVPQIQAPVWSLAQVAFFSEEGSLKAWLRQCQQHHAPLAGASFTPPPAV